MRPSTTPLASMAGAFVRGSVVMTILPREGPVASPPEHDHAPDGRPPLAEATSEPALEPPSQRPGEPEEHGDDRGQDQRLGGTHPSRLYPRPGGEPTVQPGRTHAARACWPPRHSSTGAAQVRVARPMLPGCVPGILGAVDESLPLTAIAALVRAMAARLRVQPGLQVEIDPAPARPAVLGRGQLGIFDPAPAPAVSPDGACRLVLHREGRDMRGGPPSLTRPRS